MIFSTSYSRKRNNLLIFLAWLAFVAGWGGELTAPPFCQELAAPPQGAPLSPGSIDNLISVLPLDNLSDSQAPLKHIREVLIACLKDDGFNLLDEENTWKFMEKHRLRYTGGIDGVMAKAFQEETGTKAILITSLDYYNETNPPKIALSSRLVSAEDPVRILWVESKGLAGDDTAGILRIGEIQDPEKLLHRVAGYLAASLRDFLSEYREDADRSGGKRRFRPKVIYRAPEFKTDTKYTVAVVPFLNESGRKNAGNIMMLQFLSTIVGWKNFEIIEPGVVRQELLKSRIIMEDGISLDQTDSIFTHLNVDLVLTGRVLDYQDYQGPGGVTKVDFSTLLIERKSRQVVWNSKSYNQGDDGVFFFEWGRVRTADRLASDMTRATVEMMLRD
jgi:hypothetical protein